VEPAAAEASGRQPTHSACFARPHRQRRILIADTATMPNNSLLCQHQQWSRQGTAAQRLHPSSRQGCFITAVAPELPEDMTF